MNSMKTLTVVALAAAALATTVGQSQALPRLFPGHGPVVSQFGPGLHITCFACNLPRPHWPHHGWGWGYGKHWGYGWYRWHPVFYGGAPVAPIAAAPVSAPAMAGPRAPTGSCNCLTKQDLPNGGVLFADICTRQSAIAPPQVTGAR